jgi:hypothetical protein
LDVAASASERASVNINEGSNASSLKRFGGSGVLAVITFVYSYSHIGVGGTLDFFGDIRHFFYACADYRD